MERTGSGFYDGVAVSQAGPEGEKRVQGDNDVERCRKEVHVQTERHDNFCP